MPHQSKTRHYPGQRESGLGAAVALALHQVRELLCDEGRRRRLGAGGCAAGCTVPRNSLRGRHRLDRPGCWAKTHVATHPQSAQHICTKSRRLRPCGVGAQIIRIHTHILQWHGPATHAVHTHTRPKAPQLRIQVRLAKNAPTLTNTTSTFAAHAPRWSGFRAASSSTCGSSCFHGSTTTLGTVNV